MLNIKHILVFGALFATTACESPSEFKGVDRGWDDKPLAELQAGIWIDPNGCDHWIIDDGVEGYLSPRLDPQGRPICSGNHSESSTVIGDFKGGSSSLIGDAL